MDYLRHMSYAPKLVKIQDIDDVKMLSYLLERYLNVLQEAPFHISLKTLAHDTHIKESIFKQLVQIQYLKDEKTEVRPEDFHIVFSNISYLHPTLKMWKDPDGAIFFEI